MSNGPQVQTLEQLFEFMAQKIEAAQGPMLEQQRAMLIADAVYEAAFFMLEVTPTNASHQLFLAAELLKRERARKRTAGPAPEEEKAAEKETP